MADSRAAPVGNGDRRVRFVRSEPPAAGHAPGRPPRCCDRSTAPSWPGCAGGDVSALPTAPVDAQVLAGRPAAASEARARQALDRASAAEHVARPPGGPRRPRRADPADVEECDPHRRTGLKSEAAGHTAEAGLVHHARSPSANPRQLGPAPGRSLPLSLVPLSSPASSARRGRRCGVASRRVPGRARPPRHGDRAAALQRAGERHASGFPVADAPHRDGVPVHTPLPSQQLAACGKSR